MEAEEMEAEVVAAAAATAAAEALEAAEATRLKDLLLERFEGADGTEHVAQEAINHREVAFQKGFRCSCGCCCGCGGSL